MEFDPHNLPKEYRFERRLNRCSMFNYSLPGFYYVTICTKDRIHWFGQIVDDQMILNEIGAAANEFWSLIPRFYKNVLIDQYAVMPNHIHGIIRIMDGGASTDALVGTEQCSVPTNPPDTGVSANGKNYGLVSKIVKSFKNETTTFVRKKLCNQTFSWQRSYYDRLLRTDDELEHARWYIRTNPERWYRDRNNDK